jgi:TonB-dependent receptor
MPTVHRFLPRTAFVLLALITLALGAGPEATGGGSVQGQVADATSKAAISGAVVSLEGSALRATTDQDGRFVLANVPEGQHQIVISYLGHRTEKAMVKVDVGTVARVEVSLAAEYVHAETVNVVGSPIAQEEARALNEQRTALNITNVVSADQIGSFPDPNAAEATQRIPGISIQRDQGEGRYVMIRGTEPRLNSMMIDGERIPSPESDVRQVALDTIPADFLQAIQVSKAIMPDMDGDAIGGSVNLVLKQAGARPSALFSVGGGYNSLIGSSSQPNANASAGGRLAGGKVGVMAGTSYLKSSRGSDDFEPAYGATLALASNSLRDYTVTRERYGFNLALDGKAGDRTNVYLKALYSNFRDQEYRQQVKHTVSSSRIDRQLKDRLETQHVMSVSGRTSHLFSNGSTLEFRASTAYGDEAEPNHQDTTFRQSKVTFNPNVTATSIDPNNIQANPLNEDLAKYTFNSAVITDGLTRDRDIVASGDWRIPVSVGTGASFFKFGAKYRQKHKFYDVTIVNYSSSTSVPMSPYLDSTQIDIYDGRYPMGPPINAAAVRGILSQYSLTGLPDHPKADPANYDATEKVTAAYGMAELYLGSRVSFVAGLRYEGTDVDYDANKLTFDKSGNWMSTSSTNGTSNSGLPMPMMHLRYAFDDSTNLRAAFTRTLARPDYVDLAPTETWNTQNFTVSRGNPDLRATRSWNYDLMFEHYLKTIGIVSAGLFHKQINDYIYPQETTMVSGGDTYRVTQPLNGGQATVTGLELAFQNQLSFLPGALAGLGVYANYTLTSSSAQFLGREGEAATLPGQARHVGNFSVWYERYGFSARLSYNYHGGFVDVVGATAANDIYYDANDQVDLSFSQSLLGKARIFVDVMNLTNSPLRYYQSVWDRPIQQESYKSWMMFGLKLKF